MSVIWDEKADPAVRHVAESFARDLQRVSGSEAQRLSDPAAARGPAVVIGVAGHSPLIDGLVAAGKLELAELAGQWEGFHIQTVEQPWNTVSRALIVAGSDRRGAVYGAYRLSEEIGVSPWYWFADVPVRRRADAFVSALPRSDRPKVRYRGFFINDEDPALSGWAREHFGGVNATMYERVFELLLRLGGNYLWPAMWAPKSFHLDDPHSAVLADEMGVVMGTSHHEPMTRAQSEWHRSPDPATGGPWNYATNAANLRNFWRGGIERMMSKGDAAGYENLVTIGMRGDGDGPMSEGTAIDLLERVVSDQRSILAAVTGKPAEKTPQVWALYKEVQDYYDQGMTVPDDVTLLFADDNWGQVRRLPVRDLQRAGGFGVYYHFDYVGAPRNYKWLNTVQIEKVWQQMNLAAARGAQAVWVVNVGDIKPMEFPLEFILRMAWDPSAMTPRALAEYPRHWAERNFGEELAAEIGALVTRYSRYAARRKPELLNESTFAIGTVDGPVLRRGPFGDYVQQWRSLVEETAKVKAKLVAEQHDAFFQLVEFPILALANLYELYHATAWNRRLASSHDARANHFLKLAEAAFARDAELTARYHALGGWKWDEMMSQVHMNYVIWNEPTQQTLPSLTRVAADKPLSERDAEVVFAEEPSATPGQVVLAAAAFERAVNGRGLEWTVIENLGQSPGGAVITMPQGRAPTSVEDAVRLEYAVTTRASGALNVELVLVPTLDTIGAGGIRIGVSIDGGSVKTVVSDLEPSAGATRTPAQRSWSNAVIENRHVVVAEFNHVPAGRHTLQIWRLDDNVVLEAIQLASVDDGGDRD